MSNNVAKIMLWIASLLPDRVRVWIARSPIAPFLRTMFTHQSATVGVAQIAAGPARGLQIITDLSVNRAYSVGTYEHENVNIIKQVCQPGMTVMDVGAHEGYLTLVMSVSVGAAGQVFAFEPMPQNFSRLRQTVTLNELHQVFPYQMAVSDGRNSRAKFEASNQSSSMGKLIEDEGLSEDVGFEVDVVSLDQIVKSSSISRVDFVKIDVEGHDLEVLEGMRDVIGRFAPRILIEFHSPELLVMGCTFLSERNYRWKTATSGTWTVLAEK